MKTSIIEDVLFENAEKHLNHLCYNIGHRMVGHKNNQKASHYLKQKFMKSGWNVRTQEFNAFNWTDYGSKISVKGKEIRLNTSPYSIPANVVAPIHVVYGFEELDHHDLKGKIIVVQGSFSTEPLMPKSFVFYNPPHHKELVKKLEESEAAAIIFCIPEGAKHAGGEYPFPIIEDGDFTIPSAYIESKKFDQCNVEEGTTVKLKIRTKRTPSYGENVIAGKNLEFDKKIVISAHIDTKKNTLGAIDNATGLVVLLLLAEQLEYYKGKIGIELLALNGEDYFSVPGQMKYLEEEAHSFDQILYNINIDGAGLIKSKTSISLMQMPDELEDDWFEQILRNKGFKLGNPWYQGDHSLFLQNKVPAVAISSKWLIDNLNEQRITHTYDDAPDLVDCEKISDITYSIKSVLQRYQ